MAPGPDRSVVAVSVGLAMTLICGCSQATATHGRIAARAAVTPSASSSAQVSPATALDGRTCAGVDATVKHLTLATVRWSPNLDPFNGAISAQIDLLSTDLYKEAPQAGTLHVRLVIAANARAFAAVARAMHSRSRGQVTRAISATRVAYRGLKDVCSLR